MNEDDIAFYRSLELKERDRQLLRAIKDNGGEWSPGRVVRYLGGITSARGHSILRKLIAHGYLEPVRPRAYTCRMRKDAPEIDPPLASPEVLPWEDLLGSVYLYISWYHTTRQLTTEQREMFADAVDRAFMARQIADGEEPRPVAQRWWRDDFCLHCLRIMKGMQVKHPDDGCQN